MQEATSGPAQVHPAYVDPDGVRHDHISKYSTDTCGCPCWLYRKEWYRFPLNTAGCDDTVIEEQCPPIEMTFFHGTEWGSAHRILRLSQGFIVGGGTHAHRGRSLCGAWMSPCFAYAAQVSNPQRYAEASGFLNRLCTPVVLEIIPKHVRRVSPYKFCCEAPMYSRHDGLLITAVHVNPKLLANFMHLEKQAVRESIRCNPNVVRVCHCGLCGCVADPNNENSCWWAWKKSNQGHYYSPSCYKRFGPQNEIFTFDCNDRLAFCDAHVYSASPGEPDSDFVFD